MKTKDEIIEFSGKGFWLRVNKSIKKHWFTQELLAQRLKINTATFRGWVYRKQFPDIETIYKITNILDESFNYLVFGTTNKDNVTDTEIALGRHLYPLVLAIGDVMRHNDYHNDGKT